MSQFRAAALSIGHNGGMAIVRSLSEGAQAVKIHPTETDMFYQVVTTGDGRRYLHLTTFGSNARVATPKSSQSIQLDAKMAEELLRLLVDTFG